MDIGVIGSGRIGSTVARLAAATGHAVVIANSRGAESLAALVAELGPGVRAGTVQEAARHGGLVLVAIPLHAIDALPAEPFAGSVVGDANNYYPGRDGQIAALDAEETTSSELLADRLPGARVVKAFNTMYWGTLGSAGRPDAPRDERLALYAAGDDPEAKRLVLDLYDELGFAPVDAGGLADGGRRLQPGSPVYGTDLEGAEAREALAASGQTGR
ncbi:MAG TPA: NAD(P)-binding domain-containing protein [Solirubrobacteraceae bacterium]